MRNRNGADAGEQRERELHHNTHQHGEEEEYGTVVEIGVAAMLQAWSSVISIRLLALRAGALC